MNIDPFGDVIPGHLVTDLDLRNGCLWIMQEGEDLTKYDMVSIPVDQWPRLVAAVEALMRTRT